MSAQREICSESALERCAAVMSRALPAVEACIQRCSETLSSSPEYDDKIASHVGWLAAQTARVSSELRQIEKHLRSPSQTAEQRQALVLAYVRQLGPDKRADVARVLDTPQCAELAESSLGRCTGLLARAIPTLDDCIERVIAMLQGDEYSVKVASHLVWMTNHLATLSNEFRQTEKHDRAMTANQSQRHELVLGYLRVASTAFRDEVARALADIEHSVSVLG